MAKSDSKPASGGGLKAGQAAGKVAAFRVASGKAVSKATSKAAPGKAASASLAMNKPIKAASSKVRLGSAATLAKGYFVAHDIPGRMRLRPFANCVPAQAAQAMLLELCPELNKSDISISAHTGSILLFYASLQIRAKLAASFTGASVSPEEALRAALPSLPVTARKQPAEVAVRNPIPHKLMSMWFPPVYRAAHAVWSSLTHLWRGAGALFTGKLNLDVLDGAAMAVCIIQRDFRSLSAITFFFALGEFLADWTRKRSRDSLADSLALKIDRVWVRSGELERQIPLREVQKGDHVVVHAGHIIPVDGTVFEGEGMVNQSSMTGEPLLVRRAQGATVYAGTVLEEGSLIVAASKVGDETRINSILHTIEESEAVKASIQSRYEHIADAIVPYNFALFALVYAATRNFTRAGSVLLVDYSCAIRLATPLTIFTGMRQAAEYGVLIKGGKFMEAMAEADVVVFDKTGTLTQSQPSVVEVLPFGKHESDSVLRLAACLEEHFVHPVGQAVVRAADAKGLKHREEHTRVEYIVAHGIASMWHEHRALIGSEHFIFDDEKLSLSARHQEEVRKRTSRGLSALYLAIGGEVAGVIFIEDSIREDAAMIVEALRRDGVKRVIMLTGDGEETAAGIAARAGIIEYKSRLLPEDKARFIARLKKEGHKVIMIGDGINDSPALSAADVGIAMADGADMAREIADIVLTNGELSGVLLARSISRQALGRVHSNFWASVIANSAFLVGGLFGLIMPGMSALLHNATTAALSVRSLRPLNPAAGSSAAVRADESESGLLSGLPVGLPVTASASKEELQ